MNDEKILERAISLFKQKNYHQSVEKFIKWAEQASTDQEVLLVKNLLQLLFISLQNIEELQIALDIKRYLEKFFEKNPEHYLDIATIAYKLQNYNQCVSAFLKAEKLGYEINPKETTLFMFYAESLAKIHEIEKSIEYYKLLIKYMPEDLTLYERISRLYLQADNFEKAQIVIYNAIKEISEKEPFRIRLDNKKLSLKGISYIILTGEILITVRNFKFLKDNNYITEISTIKDNVFKTVNNMISEVISNHYKNFFPSNPPKLKKILLDLLKPMLMEEGLEIKTIFLDSINFGKERNSYNYNISNKLVNYSKVIKEQREVIKSNLMRFEKYSKKRENTRKNINFSAGYPEKILPKNFYSMFFYLHLKDDQLRVNELIAIKAEERDRDLVINSRKSEIPISKGAWLTIKPKVSGIIFHPPKEKIKWCERIQNIEFKFQLKNENINQTYLSGRIEINIGNLRIGYVPINFEVFKDKFELEKEKEKETLKIYNAILHDSIFISYSHKDQDIVEKCVDIIEKFGIKTFFDKKSLKIGDYWEDKIEVLIKKAQNFQLYWSENAKDSDYVRKEYLYALDLVNAGIKENFILPLYWQSEFPMPPPELGHIQFEYINPYKLAYEEEIEIQKQITEFAKETNKNAIYHDKITKQYRHWLRKKAEEFTDLYN